MIQINPNPGEIVEIIGAVVDVEFPREDVPRIYDALTVESENVLLEVQQQLGHGVVRTIQVGTTDGLRRGLTVVNTGKPIMVPAGEATLGRILNVKGDPIDELGPVKTSQYLPIHRPAPTFAEQAPSQELL